MSDVNLQAIGQVISTTILVGGLLWAFVRQLLRRNETRHQQTELHLGSAIQATEDKLSGEMKGLRKELVEHIADDEQQMRGIAIDVKGLRKDVGFLKERTAGVEAAVFKRAPILDEETS